MGGPCASTFTILPDPLSIVSGPCNSERSIRSTAGSQASETGCQGVPCHITCVMKRAQGTTYHTRVQQAITRRGNSHRTLLNTMPTVRDVSIQAFARERELCKLLKDVELANRCLRNHKPIPASCSEWTHHSLDVLLPLVAQQAVLLEQAATAGVGGTAKRERAAEEAADFRLFADDSTGLCVSATSLCQCQVCTVCVILGALTVTSFPPTFAPTACHQPHSSASDPGIQYLELLFKCQCPHS